MSCANRVCDQKKIIQWSKEPYIRLCEGWYPHKRSKWKKWHLVYGCWLEYTNWALLFLVHSARLPDHNSTTWKHTSREQGKNLQSTTEIWARWFLLSLKWIYHTILNIESTEKTRQCYWHHANIKAWIYILQLMDTT